MSFEFKWPKFSPSFYDDAKHLLSTALNKGEKPAIIADRIEVNQLDMGTIPPDLEILEIGDLGRDRFRGIFRMTYAGDASICLQTKVQVNPLRQTSTITTPDILTAPPILFASTPLIVPMSLGLSNLKLRAIVVLVISRLEGVTLVFKNDPLESVQVSSTFDSLAAIQTFLQSEIERQLRDLFRTELPGIIHQLSRRWLKRESTNSRPQAQIEPGFTSTTSTPITPSVSSTPTIGPSNKLSSVPDEIESYDPTYGLRPSHPPLIGCFSNYRSLIKQKNRKQGLSVVLSQTDDEEDEGEEETRSDLSSPTLHLSLQSLSPSPKVTNKSNKKIIKPKIFHSHSAGLMNSDLSSSGFSSYYGYEGTRSSSRVIDSKLPSTTKLNEPRQTNQLGQSQEEEGELLRSRRLERFSMHSHSPSSAAPPTAMAAHCNQPGLTDTKRRPEQLRMKTSPINSLRHKPLTRPASSIFPSTQRSSMTSLPAYASHCGSPIGLTPSNVRSPIFLGSRSTTTSSTTEESSMMTRTGVEDFEAGIDIFEGGQESGQCALLASLVRGNWTLSPFSRSISHFAARSTPLRHSSQPFFSSSDSSSVSSPTRCPSNNPFNYPHSYTPLYANDVESSNAHLDSHHHHVSSSWTDLNPEDFKQKRVTKIKTQFS